MILLVTAVHPPVTLPVTVIIQVAVKQAAPRAAVIPVMNPAEILQKEAALMVTAVYPPAILPVTVIIQAAVKQAAPMRAAMSPEMYLTKMPQEEKTLLIAALLPVITMKMVLTTKIPLTIMNPQKSKMQVLKVKQAMLLAQEIQGVW